MKDLDKRWMDARHIGTQFKRLQPESYETIRQSLDTIYNTPQVLKSIIPTRNDTLNGVYGGATTLDIIIDSSIIPLGETWYLVSANLGFVDNSGVASQSLVLDAVDGTVLATANSVAVVPHVTVGSVDFLDIPRTNNDGLRLHWHIKISVSGGTVTGASAYWLTSSRYPVFDKGTIGIGTVPGR